MPGVRPTMSQRQNPVPPVTADAARSTWSAANGMPVTAPPVNGAAVTGMPFAGGAPVPNLPPAVRPTVAVFVRATPAIFTSAKPDLAGVNVMPTPIITRDWDAVGAGSAG